MQTTETPQNGVGKHADHHGNRQTTHFVCTLGNSEKDVLQKVLYSVSLIKFFFSSVVLKLLVTADLEVLVWWGSKNEPNLICYNFSLARWTCLHSLL